MHCQHLVRLFVPPTWATDRPCATDPAGLPARPPGEAGMPLGGDEVRGYNAAMTTHTTPTTGAGSSAPTDAATGLLTGLTEDDAVRITTAIGAARTETTRTVYACACRQWTRWCAARGIAPLPGEPAALCAYLTERAADGLAIGTLDLACTAIRHVHRMHGLTDPVADETVRQVRRGLRRTHGSAPRRLARPLTVADIGRIVGAIDQSTPIGTRDAAIILLGFASAMRRSELTALTLADIETRPAGLVLTVRRSKTDQEAHGQVVGVAHGHHRLTDPVAALTAWRHLRGTTPGALFTRLWRSQISLEPLSGNAVSRMLRARAQAAGLDAQRITAHSLRAGHATTAALAGVPLARIAAQTRHQDLSVLVNRYIRPLEALATTSSRDLGL